MSRAVAVAVAGVSFAAAVASPLAPVPGVAADRPAAVAGGVITLVDQRLDVAADGRFDLTVALPGGIDASTFDADTQIVVTSYPTVDGVEEFRLALDGDLGRNEDSFDISLDPAVPDPLVTWTGTHTLTLTVPTESGVRTSGALQLARSGVHPLVVELRLDNLVVADLITFVRRLPAAPAVDTAGAAPAAAPAEALAVSVVLGQTTEPEIGRDGIPAAGAAAVDELGLLADTLTALDEAGLAQRTVYVEPATIQAIAGSDQALWERLAAPLAASDLFAVPRLPFDASAAVAAGQTDRYTQLLREGEDLVDQLLPSTSIDRSVHLVGDWLSGDAATLQRNLGTRMLVIGQEPYDSLPGSLRGYTDASQLVEVELPDGTSVPAAVIDAHLAEQVDAGGDDPALTAIEVAAELVVLADQIDRAGGIVSRHGVVLARSDAGVPDPVFAGHLARLLTGTAGLRVVELGELGAITDVLLNDGRPVTVGLPAVAGPDLTERLALVAELSAGIIAYTSMLPTGSPDSAAWLTVLDALPSTAVSDADAAAMAEQVTARFERYRTAIVGPDPFGFTLTGRNSTLTFPLRNTSDVELAVRVRLSSPKLTFPDGDQIVVLAPQSETDVEVRTEALSNGKSSVFVRVYAPAENQDVELIPEVVLTARVNSLAGLGRLLTGAGLLLVLTWWARHWQRSRRRRKAAPIVARHPASGAGTDTAASPGADPGDLAPDAAASSLPPP